MYINLVLCGVNPWLISLRLVSVKCVSNAWTDVRYFLLGYRKENGSDSTARWRTCAMTLSHRRFVPLALSTSFVVLLSDTCFSPLLFLFDKERWICFQINLSHWFHDDQVKHISFKSNLLIWYDHVPLELIYFWNQIHVWYLACTCTLGPLFLRSMIFIAVYPWFIQHDLTSWLRNGCAY